jgi:hypothetical protein
MSRGLEAQADAVGGGGARSQDDLVRLVEAAGLDATKVAGPRALLPVIGRAKSERNSNARSKSGPRRAQIEP